MRGSRRREGREEQLNTNSTLLEVPALFSRVSITANLSNVLPNSSKRGCSADILPIRHMGDFRENEWFAVDEPIQELFLKGWEVIGNVLAFSHGEGVVAVRKYKGRKLLLIGEEVAAMDVCDGDLVLSPQEFAASTRKKNGNLTVNFSKDDLPYT